MLTVFTTSSQVCSTPPQIARPGRDVKSYLGSHMLPEVASNPPGRNFNSCIGIHMLPEVVNEKQAYAGEITTNIDTSCPISAVALLCCHTTLPLLGHMLRT